MSNFTYMEFGYDAGSFDLLVFNANKYSKQDCVDIFNEEYTYKGLKCTLDDVKDGGFVKYYIRPTQHMSLDFDGGVYGFVDKKERGAFPVWEIELGELEPIEGSEK